MVLQVDEVARLESADLVKGEHIVVQRKPHLWHRGVLKQALDVGRHADIVEPEKEAGICRRHLQKRHLVRRSTPERRAGLGVNAQNRLRKKIVHSLGRLAGRQDDNYAPAKKNTRQAADERLVEFIVYYLSHQNV